MSQQYVSKTFQFVEDFSCLNADCPDTCCQGWNMQIDHGTIGKYEKEAPELLDFVANGGEVDNIMKRDDCSDYCLKYANGLCSIHKDYGEKMLGDACNFYPRITRKIDHNIIEAAALSCPEIARLVLYSEQPFDVKQRVIYRIPYSIKSIEQQGLPADEVEHIINYLVTAVGDETIPVERALMRLVTISRSLDTVETSKWSGAIEFLFSSADQRLPLMESDDMDPYHLLQSLMILLGATQNKPVKLVAFIELIASQLEVEIDWSQAAINDESGFRKAKPLYEKWNQHAGKFLSHILRRWLQAQLAISSFPFAGFGRNITERAMILAIRFATIKLGLICLLEKTTNIPDEQEVVTLIYSFSRYLDHLADPALSMRIYQEYGWKREQRLRALVGDN